MICIYIYCMFLCFLLVLFTNIYIYAYCVKSMLSIYFFVKLWMMLMMFGRSTECRLRWDTRVLRNSQKARLKYRLSPELLKQWDLTDQTRSDWSNPIFSQTLDVDVSQDSGQMFLVRGGALFVVRGTQGIPRVSPGYPTFLGAVDRCGPWPPWFMEMLMSQWTKRVYIYDSIY